MVSKLHAAENIDWHSEYNRRIRGRHKHMTTGEMTYTFESYRYYINMSAPNDAVMSMGERM